MSGDTLSKEFLQSLVKPAETPEQKAAREHDAQVCIAVERIRCDLIEAAKNGLTSYTVHVTSTPEPDTHALDPSLFDAVYPILVQEVGNVSCSNAGGCIHFDWSV
jgi:hypothetical protein